MTIEAQPNDLNTQVKESLTWVTRELLGEYGLYVEKQEYRSVKTGLAIIDHIHIFDKQVKKTAASVNSKLVGKTISMDIWIKEQYLNLNKHQKFLIFSYLGREIVNNNNWTEIGLGHVDSLKYEDLQEVDYFFRNILKPESIFFFDYLKAYERVFVADKLVRKILAESPEIEYFLNDPKKIS